MDGRGAGGGSGGGWGGESGREGGGWWLQKSARDQCPVF